MPRKKGEVTFLSSDNLLAMKWKNKKNIYVQKSYTYYKKEEITQKPFCIYNKFMEIVEKTDIIMNTIESMRNNLRNIFFI